MESVLDGDEFPKMHMHVSGGICNYCKKEARYPRAIMLDDSELYQNRWMLICFDCLKEAMEKISHKRLEVEFKETTAQLEKLTKEMGLTPMLTADKLTAEQIARLNELSGFGVSSLEFED